jgi:GT2 family glycosyltransferase
MECLGTKLPVIGSDIPAFRELLHPKLHKKLLFPKDPSSLANFILQSDRAGVPEGAFRQDPASTLKKWARWHQTVHLPKSNRAEPRSLKTIKVTVCLTHRDRPELLKQALESLRLQTVQPFEILLVDDQSVTQRAQSFLDSLEEKSRKIGRFRMIRLTKQVGPSQARNIAAKAARGDYLLFMDDDNIAKPNEIEVFINSAQRTGADILTCPFDRFDGSDYPDELKSPASRWLPLGDDLSLGFYYNTFGDMNALVRRDVFLSLGGLRGNQQSRYEDAEFFSRAILSGYRLETIPESLFWYRDHTSFSDETDFYQSLRLRLKAYKESPGLQNLTGLLELSLSMHHDRRSDREHSGVSLDKSPAQQEDFAAMMGSRVKSSKTSKENSIAPRRGKLAKSNTKSMSPRMKVLSMRYAWHSDSLVRETADDCVQVLNVSTRRIYKLDHLAAKTFLLLNGKTPLDQIISRLAKKFDIPADRLRRDILKLTADLLKAGLISKVNEK